MTGDRAVLRSARPLPLALLLIGIAVLLAAALAAADPADTSVPPTEDWVFDAGAQTTISSVSWDVGYNITVTNGSSFKLEGSVWTMSPVTAGTGPIWLRVELNSSLAIDTSTLASASGSEGFYILCIGGGVDVTSSTLRALATDPSGDGGLVVRAGAATLHTVNIMDATGPAAVHTHNSSLSVLSSELRDVAGDAIEIITDRTAAGTTLPVIVWDTTFSRVGGIGIRVLAHESHGSLSLDMQRVTMDNVTGAGISFAQGDASLNDGGNGDIDAILNSAELRDIGGAAISMVSTNQVLKGPGAHGSLNLSLEGCTIKRAVGGGVYALFTQSESILTLTLESTTVTDIAQGVATAGMPGLYLEHYSKTNVLGQVIATVLNSSFERCAWGGIWDRGALAPFTLHNVSFTHNTGFGVHAYVNSSNMQTPYYVDHCTFVDNDGYGFWVEFYSVPAGGTVTDLSNCTFENNTLTALALDIKMSIATNKPIVPNLNVTDCSFDRAPGASAIRVDPQRLVGGITFRLVRTQINDTLGVFVGGTLSDNMNLYLTIEDVAITNTPGTSLEVAVTALTRTLSNVTITNLTVDSLLGDAVVLANNMGSVTTSSLASTLELKDSVIDSATGVGLTLSTNGKHLTGDTLFTVEETTITGSTRGFIVRGHDGSVTGGSLSGTQLDDFLSIDSSIDLWHVALSGPVEDKVHVLTRGEVRVYYSLRVQVRWSSGTPAIGSTVWIRDNSLTTVSIQETTSSDGINPEVVLTPYVVHASGAVSRNPYVVNASFFSVSQSVGVVLEKDTLTIVELKDNIMPEVHILSPEDGMAQQSSVLRIAGTAWDYESGIDKVLLSIDGVEWFGVEGTSSWNLQLTVSNDTLEATGGRITIRVRAVDSADNEATDAVAVRIIQTPPGVTIYYPQDGYTTNSPLLAISGVTDEGARVTVNGVEVDVTATLFSTTMSLVEGQNTVSVVSTDALGNTRLVRLQVVLDTRPPYLVLQTPEENATVNTEEVRVTARIEGGLALAINGVTVPYGSPAYPTGEGKLDTMVQLASGENTIAIETVDVAGNAFRVERRVFLDTEPPWIAVDQPVAGALLAAHGVIVVGTVDPTATLRLDGELITTVGGMFSVSILAAEGVNTIHLWAVDMAGNERTLDVSFSVDTVPPSLLLTAPAGAGPHVLNAKRLTVTGTVLAGGVPTATRLLLDGSPFVLVDNGTGVLERVMLTISPDGSFSFPYDLVEGTNTIALTVLDATGNEASATLAILLDTESPLLTATIDPSRAGTGGKLVSWSTSLRIVGSTEPGALLTLDGRPVTVRSDGSYECLMLLPKEGTTTITLTATDAAGNVRRSVIDITYEAGAATEEQTSVSTGLLIGALIVFIVLVVVAVLYAWPRLRGRDGSKAEAANAEAAAAADAAAVAASAPPKGRQGGGGKAKQGKGRQGKEAM
jgi:hypothetical protein